MSEPQLFSTKAKIAIGAITATLAVVAYASLGSFARSAPPSERESARQKVDAVGLTTPKSDRSLPQSSAPRSPPQILRFAVAHGSDPVTDSEVPPPGAVSAPERRADVAHFLASLPAKDERRHWASESVHATPPQIVAAGARIGRLLAEAEKNVGSRGEALEILAACAADGRLLTVVRAHCLSGAIRFSLRWQEYVALADLQADEEVRSLAAQDAADMKSADL